MSQPASNPSKLGAHSLPGQIGMMPATDSGKAELSLSNQKELGERPDGIVEDGPTGVQKAEAVVLAWSKHTVWAIYAWYVVIFELATHSTIWYIEQGNTNVSFQDLGLLFHIGVPFIDRHQRDFQRLRQF